MPRQIRIEYAGAIYHVMSRGDRREAIVLGDEDRELWVRTLGEACRKTGWQVDAYCLMTNHFHLVMETPQPNLVAGMKWFLGTYTIRFNTRHRLRGHLFAGRYKSVLVDGSDSEYLRVACDYVHLNPARARLIQEEERLERYSWSSYPAYLRGAAARPSRGQVIEGPESKREPKTSDPNPVTRDTVAIWHLHLLLPKTAPYGFSTKDHMNYVDKYPKLSHYLGVLNDAPGKFTIFAQTPETPWQHIVPGRLGPWPWPQPPLD